MPDIITILVNIQALVEPFIFMVTAVAYISGVCFMTLGVFQLKKVGDYRQSQYQAADFKAPIISLLTGMMLVYLPTIFKASTMTVFGSTSLPGYLPNDPTNPTEIEVAIGAILDIIRLVGVVAFVRGWFILTKIGDASAGGAISKGLTHLLGGLFAYHMYDFFLIVENTLGLSLV